MPMAIAVTDADLVLASPDSRVPDAHVLSPPQKQEFEDALAETGELLERHGHLLVVYPASLPRAHLQRLHAVRALLETDRVALLPSRLPPLGIATLVRQLRQLSVCDFGPGVLGASARLLGHYIYCGALLPSGRGLDRLPLPLPDAEAPRSGACAVLVGPGPQCVRPGEGELAGPQFATVLTHAGAGLADDWVTGSLAADWRVGALDPVPLPEESRHWWGTGRLVEFAAAIPDIAPLYQMVSSVRQELCHWCGLTMIGDRCVFCAAPVRPVERRPRALAAPGRRALT
ncbi:hypothetical protein [Streptomyces lonarensis]|uniref:Uncharacterized protein n=1 Tax=Streptomyces lonarensis TaxID=700599 RepID=A0A7X6D5E7_9ACTN|nr:hypothetical protein [Streptomyces lonarensis]NJQ08510.1 hypothetical protein [Streptomyces lonarensis]